MYPLTPELSVQDSIMSNLQTNDTKEEHLHTYNTNEGEQDSSFDYCKALHYLVLPIYNLLKTNLFVS